MASRRLDDLLPEVAAKVSAWAASCEALGASVLVYCTWRSPEEQDALYEIGRTTPGRIVTNARAWQSWHQYRRAIDAVPFIRGKCLWQVFPTRAAEREYRRTGDLALMLPEWRTFGLQAEACGLQWSGRWSGKGFLEFAHVQDTGGLTFTQARADLQARGLL